MTKSHTTLVREFTQGATSGKSNSMSIEQLDDGWTALVGYGHAAYAVRTPEGVCIRFDGWAFQNGRRHGGSTTTKTSHFPAMRTVGEVRVADDTPSTGTERNMRDNADLVTNDLSRSAPKLNEARDAAEWALNSAAGVYAEAEA